MQKNSGQNILSSVLTYDTTQLRIQAGIRNAVGLVLPLVGGLLIHQVAFGVVMAVGALVSGLAGLSGTSRQRVRTMASAMVWMGAAAFLGSVSGHLLWLAVALTMISGLLSGIMVAVSPGAAQIGMMATVALIIFTGFPATPLFSFFQMLLILAGGVLQVTLMLVFDAFQPLAAEQVGIQGAMAAVARYAQSGTHVDDAQASQALSLAETRLNESFRTGGRWPWFLALLADIEHVRGDVSALLPLSGADAAQQPPVFHGGDGQLRNLLRETGSFLMDCQPALGSGRARALSRENAAARLQVIRQMAQRLEASRGGMQSGGGQRLHYILSACGDILERIDRGPKAEDGAPGVLPKTTGGHLAVLWLTVKANMTVASSAFRHALRLAVVLGIAVAGYRIFGLQRGYWVPLTVLVVLRPDFFTTIVRGLARIGGTVGGILLASVFLAIPARGNWLSLVLIVVFGVALYAVLNFNYAVFSVFITAEIVVLLSVFEHMPLGLMVEDRILATLTGSVMALAAYLLWPGWGKKPIEELLANLIGAERLYLEFLNTHSQSGSLTSAAALYYRQQIRLARTNALAGLSAMGTQNRASQIAEQTASGLLNAIHRLHEGLVSLEYLLVHQSLRNRRLPEDFRAFATELARELHEIQRREGESPGAPVFVKHREDLRISPGSGVTDLRQLQWRLGRNVSTIERLATTLEKELP